MTRYRSTLSKLLAVALGALAIACGSGSGPSSAEASKAPVFTAGTYNLACPIPTTPGGFAPPLGLGADLAAAVGGGLPFAPITSLATVANPVIPVVNGVKTIRADLAPYILDLPSAIQLGKALFWDIQAGSDNKVACASCHFQAGGDVRAKNQLSPGPNKVFDAGTSLNYSLFGTSYPFNDPVVPATLSNDNVTGSQGVRPMTFGAVSGTGVETFTATTDPVFGTMRQVTGRNTPPAVNAVFNHRNFHDGRAQNEFNGVNPWGTRDATAVVYQVNAATKAIQPVAISIPNASLASQAVGPPLSAVEMSAAGRTFPEVGKKLLALKALGLQAVSTTDGVLGGIAAKGTGLSRTYTQLIQKAFQPAWWNSASTVTINGKAYTLTQANFSLFWGLSIMLYEATLVADQTPLDQYLATRAIGIDNLLPTFGYVTAHDPTKLQPVIDRLTAEGIKVTQLNGTQGPPTIEHILVGLDLFERAIPATGTSGVPQVGDAVHPAERFCAAGSAACPNTTLNKPQPGGVGCGFCHVGAETTSASIRNLTVGVEAGNEAAKNSGFDLRMERMFMGVRTGLAVGQAPPPVPVNSDRITYDTTGNAYRVTVTDINNTPANVPAVINTYDAGWYNVGARPSADDSGIGGGDLNAKPLSWTQYLPLVAAGPIYVPGGPLTCIDANGLPVMPPTGSAAGAGSIFAGDVMDPGFGFPILFGPLQNGEPSDSSGSFKTSHLRNVELTGPYFHNGGKSTLRQAVEMYDDGGNFANTSLPPLIHPLGLSPYQIDALVTYMIALTDDRVRLEKAPFDHPALPVPVGQTTAGADIVQNLPAIGSTGRTTAQGPLPRFLGLNPYSP